jgi:hypothetical protein
MGMELAMARIGLVVAMGAALAAGRAEALDLIVTYTGTVTSGFDTSGVFGGANSDLSGDPFSVTYTINPETPGLNITVAPGYSGVSGYGAADPATAVLTINGSTLYIGLGYEGDAFAQANGTYVVEHDAYYSQNTFVATGIYNNQDNEFTTGKYWLPLSYTVKPGDEASGLFAVGDNGQSAYGDLAVASVNITTGGLPEPGVWAIMLVGFFGVGAAVRDRRRHVPGITLPA